MSDEPILTPDQFIPPFDAEVGNLIDKGYALYESLRKYMLPQWKDRTLDILIFNSPELDAYAMENTGSDRICISRGALELIWGNILGLLSTPAFLPTVGNAGVEVTPINRPKGGFPPVPLLRNASKAEGSNPAGARFS